LALGLAVVFLPAAAPLLAALALGNLLRQIPTTATFIKSYRGGLIRMATLLLGLAAGSRLTSELFFVPETLIIFVLGLTAACIGSASAILYAKLLNRFRHATDLVNPLIGAAAIGALGVSARLADLVARQEDADNSILAHATSASIAGLLGAVVTAGLLLALVPLLG
jgi:oxaloacetate decarboxylase beta subunit